MKITILKSTVETALVPILKMVANARLSPDCKPTLTFQSDKQSLSIGCTLPEQKLSIVLPDAVFDEKNASFDVSLEMFRRLLDTAKGAHLSIEQDAFVVLNCDERFIGQLVPMTTKCDAKFLIHKDADSTVLPTNFANFMQQAFSCACAPKDRLALSGVNVSSRGIAGTDGHQLFHLPLPLQLKMDVTLPQSKVYASLKNLRWTSLAHWRTASGEWIFSIAGDGFRYIARALNVFYPDYSKIIPDEKGLDVRFTLTQDSAQSLQRFLDVNRNEATAELTVYPDRIELLETDNTDMKQRSGVFACSSGQSANLPCTVRIVSNNLRKFLKMGFLSLAMSSKTSSPLMSLSGIGKYLFMPCREPRSTATAPATAQEITPTTNNQTNQTNTTPNTQPKEKTTMTQTIATTSPSVSTAFAKTTMQQRAVQSNPLDDALAYISEMREQLSHIEARLLEAGRKIKSALIEQKQKERIYTNANRKLERIRLAV